MIVIIVLPWEQLIFSSEGEETVADIVGERVVKGCIIDYPVQSGGTSRFKIKPRKTYRLRYIQVYADFEAQLQRGQQISLGQLELPIGLVTQGI